MDFEQEVNDWAAGLLKSIEGDKIPTSAVSDAQNTQLYHTGLGRAAMGSRAGFRLATEFLPTSGTPATDYAYVTTYVHGASESVAGTRYLAAIAGDGSLRYKEQDDSWDGTTLTPPGSYPNPSTCIPVEFIQQIDSATMNNRLFLIAGTTRRSLLGKTYQPFGMTPPGAGATTIGYHLLSLGTSLPEVMPEDVYDVYVTGYNSATGAESAPLYLGEHTTVTAGSARPVVIRVTLASTIGDYWRVYVRRQSTQNVAYRVLAPYDNDGLIAANNGDIPADKTIVYIDSSETELADAIIPVPSINENQTLDPSAVYIASFGRRMIAASRKKIFWSKLDLPDVFPSNNNEALGGDTGEITGLLPINDETLLITTTTGTYGLFGIDPQYWTLKPIDRNVGCVGRHSMVRFDGGAAWWSPQAGPVIFRDGQIQHIAHELLGHDRISGISKFLTQGIWAGWDPEYDHIAWAVPDVGDLTNTVMLVYNYRLDRWVSDRWDPFPVACMTTGYDNHGTERLFVMDTGNRLYYLDTRTRFDGLPGGTYTGTFTAGSGEISTIGSSGFWQQTVGSNTSTLAKQTVRVYDADGQFVGRRMISSNTATTLTLDRTLLVTSGQTYTFMVSVPHTVIASPWFDNDMPFFRKRWDRIYVDLAVEDSDVSVYVETQLNRGTAGTQATVRVDPGSVATTDATWDVGVLTSVPFVKKRLGVWKPGHVCRVVVRNTQPTQMIISHMGVTGRVLNERYLG